MGTIIQAGDLMGNPAARAGFASDGKITKRSTTQIITSSIETATHKLLRYSVENKTKDGSSFTPTDRERLVFNNIDTYSAQFVAALPCLLGIMHDRVMHEAFAKYLALPSPAMISFCDPEFPHWIGRKGKEQLVDQYGDAVARAEVNGGDWIRSHEQLKVLYDDILKKAGFFTTKEARNIFHGTVKWKYLKLYRDSQVSKDAIIPDILIHNYPSDTNGHGNAVIAAITDVKTVRVDKGQNNYRPGVQGGQSIMRAVKKKTGYTRNAYLKKAMKLDEKFAPGDINRPFSQAIKQTIATGNVIPLVSGAFAEVNVEAQRLIVKCAKHAAALEDNSDITPEEISSAKGSAYNLLLSQFRRGIGCLGMKVAVEEKLRRIMLIRSNKQEANAAAHNGTSNHRKCFNKNTPRWSTNQRNEAHYDAFYRYRTKYDNFYTDEDRNSGDF